MLEICSACDSLFTTWSSLLLQLDLLLKALKSSDLVEHPVDAQFFSSIDTLLDEWKLVITKFSNKEPELPLALLRAILDMIETQEALEHDMGNYQLYLCASFFFFSPHYHWSTFRFRYTVIIYFVLLCKTCYFIYFFTLEVLYTFGYIYCACVC